MIARQRAIDIDFNSIRLGRAFKIDTLVNERLIVEIKSVHRLLPGHAKQVITYLRLAGQPVGLLVNSGGETLKAGVRRLVNKYNVSVLSAPLRERIRTRS